MSPGTEIDIVSALFTKLSVIDYEKLRDIDVLALKGSHYKYDDYVYEMFDRQLKRDAEGWYETGLV